jgi:glucuronoarabinoxylan endo-1,4-beta-xylanase
MKRFCIAVLAVAAGFLIAPSATAQITGTVNFTSTAQQIDGFGVAATFGRPWFIQSATAPVPSQVVDQLFNPITGSGISMLRLGIDDVLGSGATDSGAAANSGILIVNTPPTSCQVTPTYSWDHSAGGEIWLSQQAVKYGVKRFYADSWGAPGYMKTNNSLISGGVVCDGTSATSSATQCMKPGFSDCRAAYSNYLVQYVKYYQSDGVPVTDLGWINEPNTNTSSYASMTPTAAEAITFLDAYGPIMQASGLHVNQVCCDVYNWTTANTFNTPIFNDATANSYVNIYSAHEYGQVANFVLSTGSPAKKNWMTEWGPQSPSAWNPLWDNPYVGTSRNYNDGMFIANDISNALNLGKISAYLYWYSDSTSTTGAMIQMGASTLATSYIVPARLYALTHFARFVHPGAYQVSMSTNSPACTAITQGVGSCLVTTAFVNPDGSKVINVVNNYTSSEGLSLTLDAGTSNWVPTSYVTDVSTIPDSTYPATTSTTGTFPPETTNAAVAVTSGVASVSGTALSATFPARSLTTIVLNPPVATGPVQLVLTATLFAEGDGTTLATLTVSNLGTGTAQNVQLSSASLGAVAGSTLPTAPLPYSFGDIAPGGNSVVAVNFPAGPTPGSTVLERFAGTYGSTLGAGNFGGSFRTLVPTLP